MAIARARAEARGLDNIVWRLRSLLDLPGSGLGPFDYIDCCGVLHHLPDPAAGLRALLSVLAPGGGMGLMVYAPHGRTGVYMLQDALRLLAPADGAAGRAAGRGAAGDAPSAGERLAARQPLFRRPHRAAAMPASTTCCSIRATGRSTSRRCTRCSTAPGWRSTCLMEPMRYDPATYLPDPRLRARIGRRSTRSGARRWPRR